MFIIKRAQFLIYLNSIKFNLNNNYMITKEIFNNSFYYIGPGFDFEPLSRFSHLCNTFIYANLWYTKSEVLKNIKLELENNDYLQIESVIEHKNFDELSFFEFDPNYKKQFKQMLDCFSDYEKDMYFNAFREAESEQKWLLEINLTRKGLNRKIKLYYFTGEGLACYALLSKNGLYPPKVLCTIQSGVLEFANGLMHRVLKQQPKTPLVWIRGIEDSELTLYNKALNRDALYSNIAMDLNYHWNVNSSYKTPYTTIKETTKRYCKAYITDAVKTEVLQKTFRKYNYGEILFGLIQDVINVELYSKILIIVPSRLIQKVPRIKNKVHVSSWDAVTNTQNKVSLLTSLEFIEKLDNKLNYEAIYFTLNGLEDEGALIDQFLNRKHNAKMFPVVKEAFDLYELRTENNILSEETETLLIN